MYLSTISYPCGPQASTDPALAGLLPLHPNRPLSAATSPCLGRTRLPSCTLWLSLAVVFPQLNLTVRMVLVPSEEPLPERAPDPRPPRPPRRPSLSSTPPPQPAPFTPPYLLEHSATTTHVWGHGLWLHEPRLHSQREDSLPRQDTLWSQGWAISPGSGTYLGAPTAGPQPSCLHTTEASASVHSWLHTYPHVPWCRTSTTPSHVLCLYASLRAPGPPSDRQVQLEGPEPTRVQEEDGSNGSSGGSREQPSRPQRQVGFLSSHEAVPER